MSNINMYWLLITIMVMYDNERNIMKNKIQKQLSKLLAAYHKKYDAFGKEINDTKRIQRKK